MRRRDPTAGRVAPVVLAATVACAVAAGAIVWHTAREKKALSELESQAPAAPAAGEAAARAPAPPKVVRPPALAGTWYEGSREALEKEVRAFLAAAPAPAAGARRVGAIVAPHAGYRYAGPSQGAAFRVLEGARYRRVILLGPSHYAGFRGISIAPVTHYETPLGEVPLDLAAVEELRRLPLFAANLPEEAHAREHSLEIELPFLQAVLGEFTLVPVLVGQVGPRDIGMLANALRPMLDEGTLVVGSSDFTHYGARFGYEPFPPAERKGRLADLDLGAARLARAGDTGGFLRYLDETGATVCGARPIAILLSLLPAGFGSDLLSYTTSADVTGEDSESVSYVALAFRFDLPPGAGEGTSRAERGDVMGGKHLPPGAGEGTSRAERGDVMGGKLAPLSPDEQARLVALARFSLERAVRTGGPPPDDELRAEFPPTPGLERPRGVFVTLKVSGELRGCMGMIFPEAPLYRAAAEMAATAALRDPRFRPVDEGELASIRLEVSALTPPRPVPGPEAVRVGRDGVLFTKGRASAVFLPQVATEQGWDRETLLSHLARKAGLEPDAWREGANFMTFEAEIAGEEGP